VELMIGVRRDPDWGLVLMVGLGGIWAEALHDMSLLSGGATPTAVIAALRKLKGAALLAGFRGAPPCDLAAIADTATRLAAYAAAHLEIVEIELNPLVAYPDGTLALDALIIAH
jgi:acetate---CoA ligase (ADP-forming)